MTYAYIDKSSDNQLQRLTYSDQKKLHFVRPMTICAVDGRIIDVYGPYFATNNDSTILTHVLKENEDLTSLLKPKDVVILDRGFSDCAKHLTEKYGYLAYLPACNKLLEKLL